MNILARPLQRIRYNTDQINAITLRPPKIAMRFWMSRVRCADGEFSAQLTSCGKAKRSPNLQMTASLGVLAMGAMALGAMAVGRLAIGNLALKRGRARELHIGRLQIDEVMIGRIVRHDGAGGGRG
jgi:hypothetical protein